ncbi:hypothetical protein FA132_35630, partial [Pseudomonas aeruginosa]|nr:hypothetical protein [Pseudomonas aeruginosa]
GRISVESVVRCSWNGWPDDRGIRTKMFKRSYRKLCCELHRTPLLHDAGCCLECVSTSSRGGRHCRFFGGVSRHRGD